MGTVCTTHKRLLRQFAEHLRQHLKSGQLDLCPRPLVLGKEECNATPLAYPSFLQAGEKSHRRVVGCTSGVTMSPREEGGGRISQGFTISPAAAMTKVRVLVPRPWVCKYSSLFTHWGQPRSVMSSNLLKSAKMRLTSRRAGALGQPGKGGLPLLRSPSMN